MSATDAAINIAVTALKADSVLSLPNGTGGGQSPSGVNGEVYQGTSDTGQALPRGAKYPAILIVEVSTENVTNQRGDLVQTNGLFMVKIVADAGNLAVERSIAERVETVLHRRSGTWTRGVGYPSYYVSTMIWRRNIPQPNEVLGDKVYRFKNLVYECYGRRQS